MSDSLPAYTTAICEPSGEITGPFPTRESSPWCATGANQVESPPKTAMESNWFVPSRNRPEYGVSAATNTRLPSFDHDGLPGPKSGGWICLTSPEATSTTLTLARRQTPSTLRNAICFPSGDQAAPIADPSVLVRRRLEPVFWSKSQMSRSWPARSLDQARWRPSGDQAGSVSRNRSEVMLSDLAPNV